jgi:NADH-quinone oxidoreductase subunit E
LKGIHGVNVDFVCLTVSVKTVMCLLMALSEETKQAIIELQQQYPEKRSALIPALHLAQGEVGYLPAEIQEEVAVLFDLDVNEVTAIVTFYDMFFEKPVGKHLLHVCKNVSCMLRGGDEILQALCEKLQVKPNETTADGLFTVIPCECMAACDRAPMMLAGEEVVGPLSKADIDPLLSKLASFNKS